MPRWCTGWSATATRWSALDLKTTPGRLADVADQVAFVGGGLGGVERLERVIREHDVDRIAHMVYTSSSRHESGVRHELETMVMGTVDVFEAAAPAGVRPVVFPSSIHYYGPQERHGEVALAESAPSLATTIYGVSSTSMKRSPATTAAGRASGPSGSLRCTDRMRTWGHGGPTSQRSPPAAENPRGFPMHRGPRLHR